MKLARITCGQRIKQNGLHLKYLELVHGPIMLVNRYPAAVSGAYNSRNDNHYTVIFDVLRAVQYGAVFSPAVDNKGNHRGQHDFRKLNCTDPNLTWSGGGSKYTWKEGLLWREPGEDPQGNHG